LDLQYEIAAPESEGFAFVAVGGFAVTAANDGDV